MATVQKMRDLRSKIVSAINFFCRFLFKYYKPLIEILTIISMLAMAGFTAWLGWETRALKLADLGPNISVADVEMQLLDQSGSILKQRSWLDGELYQRNASSVGMAKAIVTIRFANTGKNAGYVKMLNYREIIEKVKSSTTDIDSVIDTLIFVPAQGRTGNEYLIDIKNVYSPNFFVDIPYEIQTYSIKWDKIHPEEKFRILVRCAFPVVDTNSSSVVINPSCKPVRYFNNSFSDLNNINITFCHAPKIAL